jgi:uracil-DNA glycosylase
MVHDFPQLPDQWQSLLQDETEKPYFKALKSRIRTQLGESAIFPPPPQIFRAFELCPPGQVKVVIIGQDPYHSAGQAHGLCFSVNHGVRVPPSLKNIYKELESDVPGFKSPLSGDLQAWAKQGVLMLNAILTVKEGSPGSHRTFGWEKFTDAVIRKVSELRPTVVFLLWGNYAIQKRQLIDENKHLVLTAAHPSPLARGAFFGCRHFSKTNAWLISKGLSPVNWSLA